MQSLSWRSCLILLGLGLAPVPFALAQAVVGGVFEHVVRPGESLTLIGARHGVDPRWLARENGLDWQGRLRPGQRLKVDNRHLVPEPRSSGIVINIPQRLLFLFREGRVVAHYPVGLGRPDWPTPVGRFRVREKAVDKTWVVPPSIQAEMAAKGLVVRERVPPGPDNPLGRHWMGLAPGNWGIHSTIAPASVYHFQSHGCIRLHPDDAADLFERIAVGEPVEILYQPLLLARAADGTVYLEVHRDAYNRGVDYAQELNSAMARLGIALDPAVTAPLIARREGVVRALVPTPPQTEASDAR